MLNFYKIVFSRCSFDIDISPEEVDAYEGERINLKCQNKGDSADKKHNWRYCQWKRERDGSGCTFRHVKNIHTSNWEIYELCEGTQDIDFVGSPTFYKEMDNNVCGIHFPSILKSDEGLWTCSLTYYNVANHNACITHDRIRVKVNIQ